MSGVEIIRTNNTLIRVKTQASGNRITADHLLWFARELQAAIDAGMPADTEVKIRNETGVNGVTITAQTTISQAIP